MIHELGQLPQGLLQLELHYNLNMESQDMSKHYSEYSQSIALDETGKRSILDNTMDRRSY